MKTLGLTIFTLVLGQLTSFSQSDTIIKKGYVNLATLIVDFDTYEFEGGNLSYYSCLECTNDSLPFKIDITPPLDYGDISFKLIPTSDTVFNASIIWMGRGQINYPGTFSTLHPFEPSTNSVIRPFDIKYFIDGKTLLLNDTELIQKADTAWNIIDTLLITNQFSNFNYKAGIYLYPPSIGIFDPMVAKWIVFLYFSEQTYSLVKTIDNNINIILSPNPTKSTMTLNNITYHSKISHYKIVNIAGIPLIEGIIDNDEKVIDLSSFANGMYYLIIFDNDGNYIDFKKIIKI